MSRYVLKLPDLGEGTVDAEVVAWRVAPGDVVAEDDPLLEVMTEKATVEVPAPVAGRVVSVHGAPGERLPVGSELAVLETAAGDSAAPRDSAALSAGRAPARVLTSPSVRRRAREASVDLSSVAGSGPGGRVLGRDLQARLDGRPAGAPAASRGAAPAAVASAASTAAGPANAAQRSAPAAETEEIRIVGVRRVIAERLSESARTIPHFSYVEEVDVTELERLRVHLNARRGAGAVPLTYLPFLILALARTLVDHPQCNALHDAARGVLVRHRRAHVGVATQTAEGLKVPVVRDAGSRTLEELAREIRRLTEAARANTATRAELSGSTITVTSLGKLGGIASTPIINAPELAIVGVNRAVERPAAVAGAVAIRRMMNLSASFDHRFIDGYVAAAMIQGLKERLEHPATIFMDREDRASGG